MELQCDFLTPLEKTAAEITLDLTSKRFSWFPHIDNSSKLLLNLPKKSNREKVHYNWKMQFLQKKMWNMITTFRNFEIFLGQKTYKTQIMLPIVQYLSSSVIDFLSLVQFSWSHFQPEFKKRKR